MGMKDPERPFTGQGDPGFRPWPWGSKSQMRSAVMVFWILDLLLYGVAIYKLVTAHVYSYLILPTVLAIIVLVMLPVLRRRGKI
jgi:hypothetical protein